MRGKPGCWYSDSQLGKGKQALDVLSTFCLVGRLIPVLPFNLSSINLDLCGTEGGGIAWLCPGNVENVKIWCFIVESVTNLHTSLPPSTVFDAPNARASEGSCEAHPLASGRSPLWRTLTQPSASFTVPGFSHHSSAFWTLLDSSQLLSHAFRPCGLGYLFEDRTHDLHIFRLLRTHWLIDWCPPP